MESSSSLDSAKKSASVQPAPSALSETRFVSEWNRPDWIVLGSSVAAGLLLGAATYSTWLADPPDDFRNFLFLGGIAAGALFAFRLGSGKAMVLVGDAGVAMDQGGEVTRLLWSEIQSIRYEAANLVLNGANTRLSVPSQSHTRAIRAILREAAERLPKILDVSSKLVDQLPEVTGDNPKPAPVTALQIAGKRCLATNQMLTFERDARLCPNCTSIYHRDHVPGTCSTCQRPLGDAALKLGD